MNRVGRSLRRAAVDVLVTCARSTKDIGFDGLCDATIAIPHPAFRSAIDHHRVGGIVYRCLEDCERLDQVLIEYLRAVHDDAVRRHLRASWELRRLAPILNESGVPWAVIKGPAMVELVYGDPGLRPYSDLDVVVAPAGFDRVLSTLAEAGLRPLDRNWTAIRRQMFGELHFLLDGDVPLDLHWNFVNLYRGRIRIPTGDVLDRARPESLAGVKVPVLEATDALLHLALHATLSGADRLIWILDVARAIEARPPDWELLVRRAREWHIGAPVGLMLDRARRTLGAEIPAHVTDELLGRGYRILSSAVDRISPWQLAEGRLTSGSLLLTRSMGLGIAGAMAWLAARTVRHFDPREPRRSSAATPSGGRNEFEAFVRTVVASESSQR